MYKFLIENEMHCTSTLTNDEWMSKLYVKENFDTD